MSLNSIPLEIQTYIISFLNNPLSVLNTIIVLRLSEFYSNVKIRNEFKNKFQKVITTNISEAQYLAFQRSLRKVEEITSDFFDNVEYLLTKRFDYNGKLHGTQSVKIVLNSEIICDYTIIYSHDELLEYKKTYNFLFSDPNGKEIITFNCKGGLIHGKLEKIWKGTRLDEKYIRREYKDISYYYYNFGKKMGNMEEIKINPGYCEAFIKDKTTKKLRGCSRKAITTLNLCKQHQIVFDKEKKKRLLDIKF